MSAYIALHKSKEKPKEKHEMVQFLSVILLSDFCGISVGKTLHVFSSLDCDALRGGQMMYILLNLLAFLTNDPRNAGDAVWFAKRDATQPPKTTEKCAHKMSQSVFFSQTHTTVTLDNDLHGCRAKNNHLKLPDYWKADKERHSADVICVAMFRATFEVCFNRRGEGQAVDVRKLLDLFIGERGEASMHGLLAASDRGYKTLSLLRTLGEHEIGAIMIMPEHKLRCHPFIVRSFFYTDQGRR